MGSETARVEARCARGRPHRQAVVRTRQKRQIHARFVGLPELTIAVRTSLLSCKKAGETRIFTPVQEPSQVRFANKGFGASKPVAPNVKPDGSDDPDGRQKNPRVEIVFGRN